MFLGRHLEIVSKLLTFQERLVYSILCCIGFLVQYLKEFCFLKKKGVSGERDFLFNEL